MTDSASCPRPPLLLRRAILPIPERAHPLIECDPVAMAKVRFGHERNSVTSVHEAGDFVLARVSRIRISLSPPSFTA